MKQTESPTKWHANGNWGYWYRGWEAKEDHYVCDERGHRMYGKKVIVECRGMGDFEVTEYKEATSHGC